MANRTLRRDYSSATESTNSFAISDGRASGSESERIEREPDIDTVVNGDGDIDESNSRSDGCSVGVVEIDPEQLGEYVAGNGAGSDTGSDTRKRRGRKPGSKNRGGKAKAEASVEPFLMMAHQWAAVLLKTPEIALDANEAKQLSDAYSVFCEHHDVPVLSPKRLSEINLIAAMFMIYGPRFVAVKNRIKQDKAVKQAKNVTPFVSQVAN